MVSNRDDVGQNDGRIEWVEPEMTELNVTETAQFPNRGRDGGRYVDCTRS